MKSRDFYRNYIYNQHRTSHNNPGGLPFIKSFSILLKDQEHPLEKSQNLVCLKSDLLYRKLHSIIKQAIFKGMFGSLVPEFHATI